MIKTRDYAEYLHDQLKDIEQAAAYLNAAIHDNDPQVFLLALRDIAQAQGGMHWLAKQTDLNREHLYRTLSWRGNPRLHNFLALLRAVGLEMAIMPRKKNSGRKIPLMSKKFNDLDVKKSHRLKPK